MNPERNTERIDEARVRAAALTSLIDAGVDVDVDDIQRAALIELSPAAVQAVYNVAHLAVVQMDSLAAILAGVCHPDRVEMFASLGAPRVSAPPTPARRPRRCRPSAADRARAAEQWLAGPAWELGPEPEPRADGGQP